MSRKILFLTSAMAALSVGLIALPGVSKSVEPAPQAAPQEPTAPAPPVVVERMRIVQAPEGPVVLAPPDEDGNQAFEVDFGDAGGSWLGVEVQEVSPAKARDLKLSAERGVLVGKVLEESPAAKAGLKDGDVVTEINGQRVEGTAQFRRMLREIPAGRSVQLTIWRGGRSQPVTATLGKMQDGRKQWSSATPRAFAFKTQQMPEIAPFPELPSIEWDNGMLAMNKPRLGIDAEDISGQLGSYFGAPDGEGVLVRDVNADSAAEKAGVKAGDVITSLNGDRIHGLAELRSKLSAAGEGKTAKLGVLRNKTALTLDVEIPAMKAKTAHKMEMRTKI